MPALEIAQETGKLISWLKKEGEAVSKGEPLLEVETDKAVMEVEAPADGVLAGVKVGAGTEVAVGKVIAWIVRPGEPPPAEESPAESARKMASPAATSASAATVTAAAPPARDIKISPKARRLAAERGVDLAGVRGSGSGGEILAADIIAAAETKPSTSAVVEAERASPIARLMAERTTQSWTTVPHFFLSREVDAAALNRARELHTTGGGNLTHTDLLVSLVAQALLKHPLMNSSWRDGRVHSNNEIHVAIAMAVEDGVVAPVIHNADRLDLGKIALQRADLTQRARAGKLRPQDLAGATFTLSNLGMFGVDAFAAIITPPQAAVLAVGAIHDKVVAVEGQPAVRSMMILTLSVDHRVADGARAARFLEDLTRSIRSL
jgi:pyruvate dehydrogenase E2 component (dihydrolipoamide acetyltransferase)